MDLALNNLERLICYKTQPTNYMVSRCPTEKIKDIEYTDDLALLPNATAQAESLLQGLEKATRGIGLCNEKEFVSFKQDGSISISNCKPLKLEDNFACLSSNISSAESNINVQIEKAWTATDRLSIIWKSNLSYKIKRELIQGAVVLVLLYSCPSWILTKR